MSGGQRALALLGGALICGAGQADHAFILPSSTLLSGDGNTVTFDAAGSDHVFFFDHRPLPPETITVRKPDGTPAPSPNVLRTRFRSVLDVRLDQQGTWKVSSQQVSVNGSLKLDGVERRVGGRGGPPPAGAPNAPLAGGSAPGQPREGERRGGEGGRSGDASGERRLPPIALADIPANATDLHLVENVGTAETFVTAGAPTMAVFAATGHGLELQPITHPNSLVAGESARFRLLLDGRPAAGIKVAVVAGGDRYRDGGGTIDLVTGADGVVAVKWPAAGMYWLGAETDDRHPAEPRAERRHLTYSATLEVMTP